MSSPNLEDGPTGTHGAEPLPEAANLPHEPSAAIATAPWGPRNAEPARRPKQQPADATCTSCGTSVPWNEAECAFCARQKGARSGASETLLHWLFLVTIMGALFGGAYLLVQ